MIGNKSRIGYDVEEEMKGTYKLVDMIVQSMMRIKYECNLHGPNMLIAQKCRKIMIIITCGCIETICRVQVGKLKTNDNNILYFSMKVGGISNVVP